jgi:hypothetical protein
VATGEGLTSRHIASALGHGFRVNGAPDFAVAITSITTQCPDVLVAAVDVPPYGAELLLVAVARLRPSIRRVLIALLPDEVVSGLRDRGLAHEVVPAASGRTRLVAAVRGELLPRADLPPLDQHSIELFSRLRGLSGEAWIRLEAAAGAPDGVGWTEHRREAAGVLRSMASHSLALAEELERITIVACPACDGRSRSCLECRGRGELVRVRGPIMRRDGSLAQGAANCRTPWKSQTFHSPFDRFASRQGHRS